MLMIADHRLKHLVKTHIRSKAQLMTTEKEHNHCDWFSCTKKLRKDPSETS